MPETHIHSKSAHNMELPPYSPNVKNFSTCKHCREKIGFPCRPVGNKKEWRIRLERDQLLIHQCLLQGKMSTISIETTQWNESDIDGCESDNGRHVF
jgi:hypothetical protein